MAFRIQAKLTGLDEFQRVLKTLPGSVQKRVLHPGMRKATSIVNKSAKAGAPRRSGQLYRSLGAKVKTYPSGVTVGVVEPRPGFKIAGKGGKNIDPRRYAHLVERGVKAHAVGKGSSVKKKSQSGKMHPGARAQPFLMPAFTMNQTRIVAAFEDELEKMLAKL